MDAPSSARCWRRSWTAIERRAGGEGALEEFAARGSPQPLKRLKMDKEIKVNSNGIPRRSKEISKKIERNPTKSKGF
jgi:hypothetical protein